MSWTISKSVFDVAKRGALTHRKIRRLAKILGIDQCDALGVFEALVHVTAEQAYRGDIGRMSNADIAEEMFTSRDPDALMDAFIEAGLIERHEGYRLVVHDWSDHADDSTRKKLSRNGEKFWNGDPPYKPKGGTSPDDVATCPDMSSQGGDMECLPVPEPVPEPEPVYISSLRSEIRESGIFIEPATDGLVRLWTDYQTFGQERFSRLARNALEWAKGQPKYQKTKGNAVGLVRNWLEREMKTNPPPTTNGAYKRI